jgi:hypothetical protein
VTTASQSETAVPDRPGAATPPGREPGSSSIGDLLGEVSKDLSDLVRQELALAKAEAMQSVTRAGKGAGLLSGAGLAGHFVLLFLSIGGWWALGNSLGRGWSALIVAAVWAVVGAVLALVGKKQLTGVGDLSNTTSTLKKIPPALKGHEEQNQ